MMTSVSDINTGSQGGNHLPTPPSTATTTAPAAPTTTPISTTPIASVEPVFHSHAEAAATGHYYVPLPRHTGITTNGVQRFHNLTYKNMGTRRPYLLLPLVPVVAGSRPVVNLRARNFDNGNQHCIWAMETIETAWSAGPKQPQRSEG